MPATLSGLLATASLEVRLVTGGPVPSTPIRWVHSSDLADPTPFLSGGEVLLTTGTQFPEDAAPAAFREYVTRLVARGVVALGFGTEVMRSGIPPALVTACSDAALPVFEVPYRTPFLAVIRWAADIIARDTQAHDEWAFAAQRAISVAALGREGLGAVLATLAERLGCRVALFDTAMVLHESSRSAAFNSAELGALRVEVRRLLSGDRRSSGSLRLDGQSATLQTVGQPERLRGVLAIVGGPPQDAATRAVITSAVALTEVALDQVGWTPHDGIRLRGEALGLALAGHGEAVAAAIPSLPVGGSTVAVVGSRAPGSHRSMIEDALSRHANRLSRGLFFTRHGDDVVLVVDPADWPAVAGLLRSLSAPTGFTRIPAIADLPGGLRRARRALDVAERGQMPGTIVEFDDRPGDRISSLLPSSEAASVAGARLSTVLGTDDGRQLLRLAAIWLEHNGQWEQAAQQAGMHRHSLKARIDRLGGILRLSLDRFDDRAELWMMLTALGLRDRD